MVGLKSVLRLANRILTSDGSGRPASVNLASGTVLANAGAGPVARTFAQLITDLQGAGLTTSATPTLVSWAPGSLAGGASADTSINIGRAAGSLIAVELVRTAGTGTHIKLCVYDRAVGTGAYEFIAIGGPSAGHAWPMAGAARILGPGRYSSGQWPGAIPLIPNDGSTVHLRLSNEDLSNAQTVTVRLWWL